MEIAPGLQAIASFPKRIKIQSVLMQKPLEDAFWSSD